MDKISFDVLLHAVENTKKILKNQEKIMSTMADLKAILDTMVSTQTNLIAVFEAFLAKIAGGQVVSQADMDAAVAEVQGAIDTAKAEADKIGSM